MNALSVFTKVTELAVSVGTSTIVTDAVKATTPVGISNLSKVAVAIGSMAVSAIVSDVTSKYVSKGIENTVADVKEAAEKAKNPETTGN